MARLIDSPILAEIGKKHGKSAVQIALSWGINNGRSLIPKSVVPDEIAANIEADFELDPDDMAKIAEMDVKARFNDPSGDYEYRLYSDLEGIEGTRVGRTH